MFVDRRTLRTRPFLLMSIEGTLVLAAALGAAAIRFSGFDLADLVEDGILQRAATFAGVTVLCLYYCGFYDPFLTLSLRDLATRMVHAVVAASIALAVLTYALPPLAVGRGILLLGVILTVIGLLGWRLALGAVNRHSDFQEKAVILGTGPVARRVAQEVLARPHLRLRIHGFVDDDPALQGVSIVNPRVVGTTADLPQVVERDAVGRVVVALNECRGRLPIDSLLDLKVRGIQVHDAASFYEAVTGKILLEDLRPSWLVFSDGFRPSRLARLTKRVGDVILAATGLALAAPLMLVVAVLIRLDSPGPALFAQERVGEDGRVFVLYKFRSMRADAEAETGPVWAEANDPRVTRVGRWLRKLRIDELPQLWNVLKGDMSFVGPRPERPYFVEQLRRRIPYYMQRHAVKPGITGWAQVRYPYGNSVADAVEKLQYDLYYVKNMSLGLDLVIILETIKVVLLGRGAV